MIAVKNEMGNVWDVLFPIPSAISRETQGRPSIVSSVLGPDYWFLGGTLIALSAGGILLARYIKKGKGT